jgi:hypothetical protein
VVSEEGELTEGAGIEQEVQPLADRELSLGVLLLDAIGTAHPKELLALFSERLRMTAKIRAFVAVGDLGSFG